MRQNKIRFPIETDFWGMKNYFYKVMESSNTKTLDSKNIQIFDDLSKEIIKNGFKKYSSYGITSFLSFRYPVGNLSMFEDIYRFSGGLKIYKNLESKVIFHPQFIPNKDSKNFNTALKKIESYLLDSIKRLVGNKKRIGILLSGGLDSSLICAMTRKMYPKHKIYTYSVGFKGDNEFRYSSKVAKINATIHRKITLKASDFFGKNSILKALIKQKAAPLHPNELALGIANMRSKLDLCDIVLCGEGSDDIFCGYDRLLRIYLSTKLDSKSIMQEYRYFSKEKVSKLIRNEYIKNDCELIESILKEYDLKTKNCNIDSIESKQNKMLYFIQSVHTRGLIERGANAFKFSNFPCGFVFLDSKLVNYVNSLPFDFKLKFTISQEKIKKILESSDYKAILKYNQAKYILKILAQKYLPKDIIYRAKKGFPVPFSKWDIESKMPLNKEIFKSNDLSDLNGWEKFMIFNLNEFFNIFDEYKIDDEGGGGGK